MHREPQHIMYVQGHNNCIPVCVYIMYIHQPRFDLQAAQLVASLPLTTKSIKRINSRYEARVIEIGSISND